MSGARTRARILYYYNTHTRVAR